MVMKNHITVIEDRYHGQEIYFQFGVDPYYTAWSCPEDEIPSGARGDRISALEFWGWIREQNIAVGFGDTEQEAKSDLLEKLAREMKGIHEVPRYLGNWKP